MPAQGNMQAAQANAGAFRGCLQEDCSLMSDKPAFSIDLDQLKTHRKDSAPNTLARADAAAKQHGFIGRGGQGRRGRKPSPRIQQVRGKVLPPVADEIAAKSQRQGVQQGVIIEEAWALYKAKSGI